MKKYGLILVVAMVLALASAGVASAQGGGQLHYVTYGDTLYSIANRYGVSVEILMRANGIMNPNMIYAGQPLMIPGGYYGGPPAPGYGPQPGYGQRPSCGNMHTVIPGETLSGIAYQYGVPVNEMAARNGLYNQDMVYVGQQVCVPGRPMPVVMPMPAPRPYQPIEQVVTIAPPYAPASGPMMPPPLPIYAPQAVASQDAPPAPEYQAVPAKPVLPLANHPIEVVVNGGAMWTGQAYPNFPDPNGDTVLIVSTTESDKPTVMIRSGDYEVKGELGRLPEYGVDKYRFAFRYIPAGSYDVWLVDPDGTLSESVQVQVDGGKRIEVDFKKGVGFSGPTYASPDGWTLGDDWTNPSEPGKNLGGWSNILVKTPASGLWVNIESEGGGYKAKCFTGAKGPGACDFAGLNAGLYWINIDGTQLTLKTYMDGKAYAEFSFVRQPVHSSEDVVGPVNYD